MKKTYTQRIKASALICFLAGAAALSARAQSQWFETTANNGSYSWDDALWNAPNSGAAGTDIAPFTSTWVSGQFARFANSSAQTITVTVNASESMSGMFLNSGAATLNINAAGGGNLSVVPGTLADGLPAQGFLTSTGTINFNTPIVGTGAIEEESGGGNLNLLGNNSYSGGTLFSSSATFVGYNNNNSFGTGPIVYANTTFAIMNSQGSTPITLANPISTAVGASGINFIGSAPTILTGGVSGGTFALNLRNNSVGTAPFVKVASIISGSGAVGISGANGGVINYSAHNTYTGRTTLGVSGDTSITLQMGIDNALASSSGLTLFGGTLAMNGTSQSIAGTLILTGTSTIDFANLAGTLTLGNSSAAAWTAGQHINIINYNPNIDVIEVGTTSGGLTSAQLSDLTIDGGALGPAGMDAFGNVILVPEPSSLALAAFGGLGMLWLIKRRRQTA